MISSFISYLSMTCYMKWRTFCWIILDS